MSGSGMLDLRGPVLAGAVATLALAGAGWALGDGVRIARGHALADVRQVEHEVEAVRHTGGRISRVFVTQGQSVAGGELLATVDGGDIDAEIAVLKSQSATAQLMLESIRRETQAFHAMLEQGLVSRERVVSLETQAAHLERRSAEVLARIAEASRRLARVEIRAPAAGVIGAMDGLAVGRLTEAGEKLAEILPDPRRLIVEARLPASRLDAVELTGTVTVWPGTAAWIDPRPRTARVVWIAPEATGGGSTSTSAVRLELEPLPVAGSASATLPLEGARIVLPVRGRQLWEQLLEPLRRVAGNAHHA